MDPRIFMYLFTAVFSLAEPALAHHPMGGISPKNGWEGLLSGIGHPIIGLDHFAFIILVGLSASYFGKVKSIPLVFICSTVAGCLLKFFGIGLPVAEFVITGSVILVGTMIASGRLFSSNLQCSIFGTTGLFHGWAYGESILGSELAPMISYLIGFGLTQYLVAVGVGFIAIAMWRTHKNHQVRPRLAGAVCLGIGSALFIEQIEAMVF
jgi:urease accessory protein